MTEHRPLTNNEPLQLGDEWYHKEDDLWCGRCVKLEWVPEANYRRALIAEADLVHVANLLPGDQVWHGDLVRWIKIVGSTRTQKDMYIVDSIEPTGIHRSYFHASLRNRPDSRVWRKRIEKELVQVVAAVETLVTRYIARMGNELGPGWFDIVENRRLTRLEAVAAKLESDPYVDKRAPAKYRGDFGLVSKLNWAVDLTEPSLTVYGPDYTEDGVDQ